MGRGSRIQTLSLLTYSIKSNILASMYGALNAAVVFCRSGHARSHSCSSSLGIHDAPPSTPSLYASLKSGIKSLPWSSTLQESPNPFITLEGMKDPSFSCASPKESSPNWPEAIHCPVPRLLCCFVCSTIPNFLPSSRVSLMLLFKLANNDTSETSLF